MSTTKQYILNKASKHTTNPAECFYPNYRSMYNWSALDAPDLTVVDLHPHQIERTDPDPDPSGNLDPDPQQSDKLDRESGFA